MKVKPFEDKTQCPFRHLPTNGSVDDVYRNFLVSILRVKVRRVMVKESDKYEDSEKFRDCRHTQSILFTNIVKSYVFRTIPVH